MTIPDFQSLMLPLLRFCADDREHGIREAIDTLAREFRLTEDEQKELLPSGRQRVFDNRVAWTRAHMKKALLLENTRRGFFRITERGQDLLREHPTKIDIRLLRRFPEYEAGISPKKSGQQLVETPESAETDETDETESRTPQEKLEAAYETLREKLASELVAQLKAASPSFFEKVVIEVLVKMGYGGSRKDAGQAIGRSGDEGIDGIIKEDRLGLDIIYIQAKKWESTVSRPEIQKFAGALQGKRARKGVFITTSDFSPGAETFAASIDTKIVLIGGKLLAQLMIDFDVGVATEATYELKRLDMDYFTENG